MIALKGILKPTKRGVTPPSGFVKNLPGSYRQANVEYLNGGWLSINVAYTYVPRTDVAEPADMWRAIKHNITADYKTCTSRICFDGVNYVYGVGNNQIWTTTDIEVANNWTKHTINLNSAVSDFYYNGSYFLAVGPDGGMFYSAAAAGPWNSIANPFGGRPITSLYYANGYWAAVATNGMVCYINSVNPNGTWSVARNQMGYSPEYASIASDGINWVVAVSSRSNNLNKYIYYTGASPATVHWTQQEINPAFSFGIGPISLNGSNGYWILTARSDSYGYSCSYATNSVSTTWTKITDTSRTFCHIARYNNNRWCLFETQAFYRIDVIKSADLRANAVGGVCALCHGGNPDTYSIKCANGECIFPSYGIFSDNVSSAWQKTLVGQTYPHDHNKIAFNNIKGWIFANTLYSRFRPIITIYGLVYGTSLRTLKRTTDITTRYSVVAVSDTYFAVISGDHNIYYAISAEGPWTLSATIANLTNADGFMYGNGYWVIAQYDRYFYTNDITSGLWTETLFAFATAGSRSPYIYFANNTFVFFTGNGGSWYTNDITTGVPTPVSPAVDGFIPWDIVCGGTYWYGVRNADVLYYTRSLDVPWQKMALSLGPSVKTQLLSIVDNKIIIITNREGESILLSI